MQIVSTFIKYYIIAGCLLTAGNVSFAQSTPFTKSPALGINLAYFDFEGARQLSNAGKQMKPGIAIHFQNNITRHFDYQVTLAGSFLEFPDGKGGSLGDGKKQLLLENDFALRVRLLKAPARFNPYVLAGAGWSQYNNHYGAYAPIGAGMQVNITPDVFILLNTQYRIPFTSLQRQHLFHSIGIAGVISRKKIVKPQPAPVQQPVAPAPRDSDGDGILDSADACPQVPGVIQYKGCPPPDRDGDGVLDDVDACPDVKGLAAYRGCPMPDKDEDGVADSLDKCPDLPGSAINGGCPEIESLKTMINWAAQHIFFETASHKLLAKSFPALDSVVNLLVKYPVVQLTIEGHTDNAGGVQYNQSLSERRAGSVMDYLIKAGIATSRLKAIGYGLQKPIVPNTTEEGRAINRRVVLQLHY